MNITDLSSVYICLLPNRRKAVLLYIIFFMFLLPIKSFHNFAFLRSTTRITTENLTKFHFFKSVMLKSVADQLNSPISSSTMMNMTIGISSSEVEKPKVIFVLGGPGAGKGTQCARLANEYNMKHLSAGELLRQEMATPGSEHGLLIDTYLKEGKIVPVKITLDLLKRQMISLSNKSNRFLIDGFPRNWDNVQGWEEYMSTVCEMEKVLVIECDEHELEKRLLSRGLTSGRSDDNIESARKRFRTFKEATLPVIDYYEKKQKVAKIDGNQDMDHVFEHIKKSVDPLIEQEITNLTQELLDIVSRGNVERYTELVDANVTAREPEGKGSLIEGIEFHRTLLTHSILTTPNTATKTTSTIINPHVRVLGKTAIISYRRDISASNMISSFEETRIWHLMDGRWKNVHFHRSPIIAPT